MVFITSVLVITNLLLPSLYLLFIFAIYIEKNLSKLYFKICKKDWNICSEHLILYFLKLLLFTYIFICTRCTNDAEKCPIIYSHFTVYFSIICISPDSCLIINHFLIFHINYFMFRGDLKILKSVYRFRINN